MSISLRGLGFSTTNRLCEDGTAKLEGLSAFLTNGEFAAAVLLGRGGIGKSKLLRDCSRSIDWQSVFLREAAIWHPETPKEIPAGRVLIVADDANRFADLPNLLALARDLSERRGAKLLLCGSPECSRTI